MGTRRGPVGTQWHRHYIIFGRTPQSGLFDFRIDILRMPFHYFEWVLGVIGTQQAKTRQVPGQGMLVSDPEPQNSRNTDTHWSPQAKA